MTIKNISAIVFKMTNRHTDKHK